MNKKELIELTSNIDINSCPHIINFHCHTKFSDGSFEPEQLLDQVFINKLKFIAITDHHTVKAHTFIEKNNILKKYPSDSFNLISGIEINCLLLGCLVHVIGLGINVNSKYLTPYIQGESPIGNDLHIKSVTKAIRLAGGISFLAHPARYRIPFYKLIPEANNQGVDGIEVWYDYDLNERWQASNFVCSKINKLTESLNMLKTCGTDSHGYSLLGR
ncbi:Predicted metal-dependent phosphoesterases (PHP family) [Prochlorococcus marinus str. MIT 9515]|uniref:Predicted metal-dependent phosphoesterases (PHP family) n=1 Tax=Prochlorococcus marinus (strain MIT 9515) TaxID=167542 RepID=A2BWK8_PROM5|nr:PHP domain-containing protein [Prochlorococcus marinus]ABM72169.1 Predicted metal-dependent phosphoesterases (PHP family) [Prochlorococcus marinus str. MIT 9515]